MIMEAYNHGRYQFVHNGHFNTFKYILNNYDTLFVGIANPLRAPVPKISDAELVKSLTRARAPENNPLSYWQRYQMIHGTLTTEGYSPSRFHILPHFAYYDCDNWHEFIPTDATIVLAPGDTHHERKVNLYQKIGWKVEIIPRLKGISGEIVDKEFPDGNWRELVPKGAIPTLEDYIISHKLL